MDAGIRMFLKTTLSCGDWTLRVMVFSYNNFFFAAKFISANDSWLNTRTFTNKNWKFWISRFENFIIICNVFTDAGGRGRGLTKMNSNLFQVTGKVASGGHSVRQSKSDSK